MCARLYLSITKLKKAMKVVGLTFEDQEVVMDFHEYERCTFIRCKIVFHGAGAFSLVHNTFSECNWEFRSNAGLTLQVMSAIYKEGGGGRELVESFFQSIRGGR